MSQEQHNNVSENDAFNQGEAIAGSIALSRRKFLQGSAAGLLFGGAALALNACSASAPSGNSSEESSTSSAGSEGDANAPSTSSAAVSGDGDSASAQMQPLPPASPAAGSRFAIDENVNTDTIDQYLGRDDVAYRDMRMVRDPADYASIGGDSNLSLVLPGFLVVPFPYIATLPPLPVEGAYSGDCLFDVAWSEEETVLQAVPRYQQSLQIVEELFPKDKPVLLMCGGGGYAAQMRQLLLFLGWAASRLYNVGAAWDYAGAKGQTIVDYDAQGNPEFYLWRLTQAIIDFEYLTPAV